MLETGEKSGDAFVFLIKRIDVVLPSFYPRDVNAMSGAVAAMLLTIVA